MKTNYWADLKYGKTYHFYNKAPSHRQLFYNEQDYERFLDKFHSYFSSYLNTHAYCLIPNHFHFLVSIKDSEEILDKDLRKEKSNVAYDLIEGNTTMNKFLLDQFRRFFSSTALYLNSKYKLQGQVFLEKTKRVAVKNQDKLLNLLCYIHHNPIHHGLVNDYEDWEYSSFNDYIKRPETETYNLLLNKLGDKENDLKEFKNLHEEYKTTYLKHM